MLKLHWWSPLRSFRAAAGEFLHEWEAWAFLAKQGRRSFVNFGDEASPLLLAELSGRAFRWAPMATADFVGIGSLLQSHERASSTAIIFGTGLREQAAIGVPKGPVLALRGPLTAASLDLTGVPLGDPGLAIGGLVSSKSRRTGRPIVIPHFRVFGSSEGRRELSRLRAAGFDIVLPTWEPLRVAEAIVAAEYVLTSSLHGLIFAHALSRRVQLLSFSGVAEEPAFKYQDHLSLFDLTFDVLQSSRLEDAGRLPRRVSVAMDASREIVDRQLPFILNGLYSAAAKIR